MATVTKIIMVRIFLHTAKLPVLLEVRPSLTQPIFSLFISYIFSASRCPSFEQNFVPISPEQRLLLTPAKDITVHKAGVAGSNG